MNKTEFEELTQNMCNNQNNKDFKITINKNNLRFEKTFWREVTTHKISKSEAKELYKKLLQKGSDALEREKSNNIKKHILDILNNIGTIFTGAYMHCGDVPKETKFERTIVERLKLRKEKIAQIEKEEKNNLLFKEYFTNYQ